MLFAHSNSRFKLIRLLQHAFNEPLPPLSVWRQATRANVEPLSATLCCQQNPTRDTGGRGPSSSICIVGESSALSILHLVDACACLLSQYLLFTCIIQALFWVFVVFFPDCGRIIGNRGWWGWWQWWCVCARPKRSKLLGPFSEAPTGSHIRVLQGPNYRQLTKLEIGSRGSLTGSGGDTHTHTHTSTLCLAADQQKIKGSSW